VSIPIRLPTYPWFNDPRKRDRRERERASVRDAGVVARSHHGDGHCRGTTPKRTRVTATDMPAAACLVAIVVLQCALLQGRRRLGNMATTQPPMSLVAGFRGEESSRERRRDEILDGEGDYSHRHSPLPPSDPISRETHHRGRGGGRTTKAKRVATTGGASECGTEHRGVHRATTIAGIEGTSLSQEGERERERERERTKPPARWLDGVA